jgi:hypothetical protein
MSFYCRTKSEDNHAASAALQEIAERRPAIDFGLAAIFNKIKNYPEIANTILKLDTASYSQHSFKFLRKLLIKIPAKPMVSDSLCHPLCNALSIL